MFLSIFIQTDSMSKLVKKELSKNVIKLPFLSDSYYKKSKEINDKNKLYDFIYVASGYTYKNHLNLLNAWQLLQMRIYILLFY